MNALLFGHLQKNQNLGINRNSLYLKLGLKRYFIRGVEKLDDKQITEALIRNIDDFAKLEL